MARRLPKQISSDIDLIRWLYWQTVRRLPSYRQATKKLLCTWRKCARRVEPFIGPSATGLYRRVARSKAAQKALYAYASLKRMNLKDIPPAPGSSRPPREFFEADSEATLVIDDALRSRYYPVAGASKGFKIALTAKQKREDGLPELREFTRRWGLKFPIPPSVGIPLDEKMTNGWCRPVNITRGDRRRLVLIIYPAVGREIVAACVGAALDHYSRKRKSGTGMIGRLVSRKPSARENVTIAKLPAQRRKVTIELPAHKKDVLNSVEGALPRSAASWRSREDYQEVFDVVDRSLRCNKNQPRPAKLGNYTLRDRKKTFDALAAMFALPR